LRLLSVADYRCLAGWVTTLAMQTSKGIVLVQEVIEEMRRRRLLLPLITVIERMCAKAATRAFIAGTKTNALLRVVLGRSASHPKQISGLSVLKFPFSEVTPYWPNPGLKTGAILLDHYVDNKHLRTHAKPGRTSQKF
jgi:hypothetical protein